MKKNNVKRLGLVVALIAVVGIGGSLAYFTDTDSKTNVVTLGHVNGTLNEEKDGETLEVDQEGFEYNNILPGDKLDKQPFVTLGADSEDAYVRVRVEVVNTSESQKTITDEMKQEILDGLVAADPTRWIEGKVPSQSTGVCKYYYYQVPLTQENNVTDRVFTTVVIPTTWDNSASDISFQIKVTADLVQSANIDEALEMENGNIIGWGNINIQPAN